MESHLHKIAKDIWTQHNILFIQANAFLPGKHKNMTVRILYYFKKHGGRSMKLMHRWVVASWAGQEGDNQFVPTFGGLLTIYLLVVASLKTRDSCTN
jgi:hypothetical protein